MTPEMKERTRRNLHPHAEARLAMGWWGDEYAAQRGGSMDFWDRLSPSRKAMCVRFLDDILAAMEKNGRALAEKGGAG